MALKHYGGRVPEVASTWTCPSCNAENTVPLKAGCQTCGAGGDARRVDGTQDRVQAPEASAGPSGVQATTPADSGAHRERSAQAASRVNGGTTTAHLAYEAWLESTVGKPAPDFREAFMAGVAWAQAQPKPGDGWAQLSGPHDLEKVPMPPEPAAPVVLWTSDGKHDDPVDAPTLATIFAALAFYRDNVLGYGAVPGQLNAQGVTDLLTRLTLIPQEPSV